MQMYSLCELLIAPFGVEDNIVSRNSENFSHSNSDLIPWMMSSLLTLIYHILPPRQESEPGQPAYPVTTC